MKKINIAIALFCPLLLAGCGVKTPTHEHTFNDVWDKNESSHWHQATCEHTELTKDMGSHSYGDNNICTVCGYEKVIPHEHTFSEEWSNDASSHWHQATCEHTDLFKDIEEHIDLNNDNVCDICSYNIEVIPEKYLVSFNTNNGSYVEPQIITEGESVVKPVDPVKNNFAFYGWYDNPDFNGEKYDFSSKVAKKTTLYARWGYSFTCINYDGSTLYSEVLLDGETINNVDEPTKENEVFIGWYEDESLEGDQFTFNTEIHKNTTVYASFGYLVNFYSNTDTLYKTVKVQEGKILDVPTAPSKDYHDFDDWYTDTNKTIKYNFGDAVNSSLNLYANFTPSTYTITYHNCEDATNINLDKYTYGVGIEELEDASKEGYRFYGWYSDDKFTTPIVSISTTAHGNIDVYARFSFEYTVTFTNWPSDIENPNPTSFTAYAREDLVLNPFEDYPGLTFISYIDSKGKVHESTDIDGNLVLTVNFKATTTHLTLDANGGEVIGLNNYIYLNTNVPGSKVTKYDIPSYTDTTNPGFNPNTHVPKYDGHVFKGWYLDEELTTPINKNSTTLVASGQTLYAKWEEIPNDYIDFNTGYEFSPGYVAAPYSLTQTQYTLVPYHVKNASITNYGSCTGGKVTLISSGYYNGGYVKEIYQSPTNSDFVIKMIETDCSGCDTLRFYTKIECPSNEDRTCHPTYSYNFKIESYREDYIKAKANSTATMDVTYWNPVNVQEIVREGYEFVGWSYNDKLVNITDHFTFIDESITLIAQWTKIEEIIPE